MLMTNVYKWGKKGRIFSYQNAILSNEQWYEIDQDNTNDIETRKFTDEGLSRSEWNDSFWLCQECFTDSKRKSIIIDVEIPVSRDLKLIGAYLGHVAISTICVDCNQNFPYKYSDMDNRVQIYAVNPTSLGSRTVTGFTHFTHLNERFQTRYLSLSPAAALEWKWFICPSCVGHWLSIGSLVISEVPILI
jgi:hypothetical protein